MMKKMIRILLLSLLLSAPSIVSAEPASQQWSVSQNDTPKVSVSQGNLTITAPESDMIFEIYSITGQLVKRVRLTNGTATVELHRGCYIVRCERWSKKVVVS